MLDGGQETCDRFRVHPHCPHLPRLLQIAGSDANLAKEVVELLAPHGDFYADSLWISGGKVAEQYAFGHTL